MNEQYDCRTYDYKTWAEYVRGKAEELEADGMGLEFLPGACIEEWVWNINKAHHDAVMKAISPIVAERATVREKPIGKERARSQE